MLKKFFSNALLSVVMDKTARKRLETIKSGNEPEVSPKKNKKKKSTTKPQPKSDGDILSTITEALQVAREEAKEGINQPTTRSSSTKAMEKRAAAIHQTLVDHKRSQTPPPKAPQQPQQPRQPQRTKKPSTEREKLIAEALAIQKEKAHYLDELDPKTRDKLMLMAQYTLAPDSLPPEIRKEMGLAAKAEGLVDNVGGARKPRKFTRK